MTDDFTSLLQEEVVRSITPEPQRRTALNQLKPALKELRRAYRRGIPPNFSSEEIRAAYALAYFPHHAVLASACFGAAGLAALGLEPGAEVLVLGAGPGPEVVGLVTAMSRLDCATPLTIHLVDLFPNTLERALRVGSIPMPAGPEVPIKTALACATVACRTARRPASRTPAGPGRQPAAGWGACDPCHPCAPGN